MARAQNRRFCAGDTRALGNLLFALEQLIGVEIAAAQTNIPARPDEHGRGGGVQHGHDHAGHAAVHQPLILEHQRAVQEYGSRQHNRRAENTRVAIDRVGRQQQRDRRIEIALVHLRAKGEDHRKHHRAEQKHRAAVARFDIEPHGQTKRRGIGRPRDIRPRARIAQRAPVHAQQHIKITGVDGDIVVFAQRSRVQAPQPGERIAPLRQRKRQRRGDDDADHQPHARADLPERFGALFTRGDDFADQHQKAYGRKHQRLRLDQYGAGEHRQRALPAARHRIGHRQQQKQRQHAVHLSPHGGVEDHGGIDKIGRAQPRSAQPPQLFAGHIGQQQRDQRIADDRNRLDEQPVRRRIVADVQQHTQRADRPEQQNISGRIVAPVVIEMEAVAEYPLRPALKAVHVHAEAAHAHRQHDAHDQSGRQRRPQHDARGLGIVSTAAAERVAQRARGRKQHGEQQQRRKGRAMRRFLIGGIAGRGAAHLQFKAMPRLAVRHAVHARDRHVVKPRPARLERTIAAHAAHHGDALLVGGGLSVQRQSDPFAVRVVDRLGIDERVLDGNARAHAALLPALDARHAGDQIPRVRLNGDRLLEARVVFLDILHADRLFARIRRIRQRKIAHALVPVPAADRPVVRQLPGRAFKAAVDDQLPLLRRGCAAADERKNARARNDQRQKDAERDDSLFFRYL